VLVIKDGHIIEEALGSGALSLRELLALLRVEGVRDVGEVEAAYFENNGKLSVFRYPAEQARRSRSTEPLRTSR